MTEGGVATALFELSRAGGYGLRVHLDALPVLEDTRAVCRALKIDPLGLIGSGSLLIACRPEDAEALVEAARSRGIPIQRIGEVLDRPPGVEAVTADGPCAFPAFEVDEMTRVFE